MVSQIWNETQVPPHGWRSLPAAILTRAQDDRFVIQDFCPFPRSIEWD